MSVSAALRFSLLGWETSLEGTQRPLQHKMEMIKKLVNGTSNGTFDILWSNERTVSASSTDSLDLAGSLTMALGSAAFTAAKIVGLVVFNLSTTSGDILQVGPGASNGCLSFWVDATDLSIVDAALSAAEPGVLFQYSPRGRTVTASTGDKLAVINPGANDITYRIALLLRSA